MILGCFVCILTSIGYLTITGYVDLYILQACLGISSGLSSSSRTHFIVNHMDDNDPAACWQIYRVIGRCFAAISAVAGGYISHNYGFKTILYVWL